MFARCRRWFAAALAASLVMLTVTALHARAESAASLYRIFLQDGSTLVSYGEFAKVADRVVFSIPIGENPSGPNLQLVSIAQSTVDWDRTDKYANAVRARRYAETRGEDDFALLTGRVAEALYIVASTKDPAERLRLAEEARGKLAQWPAQNYGYRAADVVQLSSTLDEVISELRVAAGESTFELSLVATSLPPPPVDLLPPPDERELALQALTAARLTPEPVERMSLLRAVTASLKEPAASGGWASDLYARATADLASELRTQNAYTEFTSTFTRVARTRAARGDVRGLQLLVERALTADDRLGRRRPHEVTALLGFLDLQLDEARRVRLAADAWSMRRSAFADYRKRIGVVLADLRVYRPWLEDIKQLAGPSPDLVARLEQKTSSGMREMALVVAPAELEAAHGLFKVALDMAHRAATTRRSAVSSRNMKLAWDASSAAAGAQMLFDQAVAELDRLATSPSPQR